MLLGDTNLESSRKQVTNKITLYVVRLFALYKKDRLTILYKILSQQNQVRRRVDHRDPCSVDKNTRRLSPTQNKFHNETAYVISGFQ